MQTPIRAVRHWIIAVAVATAVGCGGGGSDAPTTPPPPPPPPVSVAAVELSASTVDLAPAASSQLRAVARSSAGVELTDRSFTWSVAAPTVASVSAAGLVTGVSEGVTTVTVSSEGKSASTTVRVRCPVAAVVVSPATVQTSVGGAPVQLVATARDGNGAELSGRAFTWTSSNSSIATVSASGAVTAVGAGSAIVTAASEGRQGTSSVTVAGPDPCAVVRAIAVGQTLSSALSAADCRLDDGSALQTFSFTVPAETALEIEMTSTAVDPYLFVYDEALKPVAEDDDGGAGVNARVLRSFPAGKYYVVANAYAANSFGAYQLAVRPAPAPCVSGRATTLPATVTGALAAATSCRLNDDSYFDRYELTIPARTTVRMDLSSSTIDPFIVAYDASGKLIALDDDGGNGLDARIEAQLEAGRYTIIASAQPNQVGAYRLDIAAPVDPCAVNRTIAVGQNVTSTLSVADCATTSQGPAPFAQRWMLSLPLPRAIQVDMSSTTVDTYLIIQNAATGQTVAENDDVSSSSTNSRIVANLPAGQYIVNATTYELGETGTYSLAVSPIAPTTPVSISVSLANVALSPGQQQQMTATISGSANTGVSWQSSATGVATVTNAGLVRAVTAGTATITARADADPSKTATVSVSVTQPTSGQANLDIAAMYVIQSVQQLDGSVKLVANRDAVARVFLRGSRNGMGPAAVRLRLYQGVTLLQTLQGTVTPATTVDEACCSADVLIPGALIRAGVSILADADPANTFAESNETDNSYPMNGTPLPLNVVSVSDFNLRLVPIRQNRSGQTGVATTSVTNVLRSLWPLSTVNVTARAPLSIDYALVGGSFTEWSMLVRDLELARRADGSNSYYYGMVRVGYTSGVLGLAGGIPSLSAVGVDEGSSFGPAESRFTLAHEIGHTMGLRHAPCGGAAGPDPAYPFTDARTGAFGMDIAAGNVIKLPGGTDIMSYCDNQWVSVYNYRNVLDIRARNPNGVPAGMLASEASPVLMVSGSVSAQTATIDGSFAMTARPSKSDPAGRFVVEGFDADGKTLFSHRFTPFAVSDSRPDEQAFVVGVPAGEHTVANVVRIAVRELSGAKATSRTKNLNARADMGAALETTGASGSKRLQWSTSAAPMVLVRDQRTGEVMGVGRNGALDLSQFSGAGEVEVLITDGVTSARRRVSPSTGAIRQ